MFDLNIYNAKSPERKQIGYEIDVTAEAYLAGKSVRPGEVVGFGSKFNFEVKLRTQEVRDLRSGNFGVKFDVMDASMNNIHVEKRDCRDNT